MFESPLPGAVERLAQVLAGAADTAMDRPWVWGEYDGEGVRFAGFVAYGALCELAALTAVERAVDDPPTVAQRILEQYHAAYRDLQALLLDVDAELAERSPGEGQWSVRETLRHLVEADAMFYATVRINLDRQRAGEWTGERPRDEDYEPILGSEAAFNAIMDGPFAELVAYHADIHDRTLAELTDITDAETEQPARYWESQPYTIRFRLQRFDAHIRQHIIQIEQILAALDHAPTEGRRLARLLYAALAKVEGALIGAADSALETQSEVAETIEALASEVAAVLE